MNDKNQFTNTTSVINIITNMYIYIYIYIDCPIHDLNYASAL